MNTLEAIKNRHSYRGKFKNTKVPREDLRTIMQAGIAAPSGCNKQTACFIAVDDSETLGKLKSVINPPVAETAPAAIGVAADDVRAPAKKAFEERAWFNLFGNED